MYTCVLMPRRLCLVLRMHPDANRAGLEMDAMIWSKEVLSPGTLFSPLDGDMVLDKVDNSEVLDAQDIKMQFGCYDDIQKIEDQDVRHCNWIRFVKASSDPSIANMICSKLGNGQTIYQVTRFIMPNDEICVYFPSDWSLSGSVDVTPTSSPKTVMTLPECSERIKEFLRNNKPKQDDESTDESGIAMSSPSLNESDLQVTDDDKDESTPPRAFKPSLANHAEIPTSLDPRDEKWAPLRLDDKKTTWPSSSDQKRLMSQVQDDDDDDDQQMTSGVDEVKRMRKEAPCLKEKAEEEDGECAQNFSRMSLAIEQGEGSGHAIKEETEPTHSVVSGTPTPNSQGTELQQQSMDTSQGREVGQSLEGSRPSPVKEDRSNLPEPPEVGPCPVNVAAPNAVVVHAAVPEPMATPEVPQAEGAPATPGRRARVRQWWKCYSCGKRFDRPSLLTRHIRTHTGEKPHVCDVCAKPFSTSSSLNTHRRIHSGEKPHECPDCGKCFTASSNLYYHRMTHKKEKPHKCPKCPKSFPTPGDLRSHEYVHTGSWPFKCSECSKGFSKQTNLKNHMALHSGEKPFECEQCHKRFALQCNLKTHMKTHDAALSGRQQQQHHHHHQQRQQLQLKTDSSACPRCGVVFTGKEETTLDGTCMACYSLHPHPLNATLTPTTSPHAAAAAAAAAQQKAGGATAAVAAVTPRSRPRTNGSSAGNTDFSISKLTDRASSSASNASSSSSSSSNNSATTSMEMYSRIMSPVAPTSLPHHYAGGQYFGAGGMIGGANPAWMIAGPSPPLFSGLRPSSRTSPSMMPMTLQYHATAASSMMHALMTEAVTSSMTPTPLSSYHAAAAAFFGGGIVNTSTPVGSAGLPRSAAMRHLVSPAHGQQGHNPVSPYDLSPRGAVAGGSRTWLGTTEFGSLE